jgi:predicted HicB family RNase H-like nuclease
MRSAIDIRDVPASLAQAVWDDAAKRNVSVNDLVAEIVCQRYGIPYTPTGYPFTARSQPTSHWNLRVPDSVHQALRALADTTGGTVTGHVLFALSEHYGVETIPPTRRSSWWIDPEVVREARQAHQEGESLRSLSRRYGIKRETLTREIRREEAAA